MAELNTTVIEGEASTWRSVRGSLNSVIAFVATLLMAWILYRLLQVVKAVAEVKQISWNWLSENKYLTIPQHAR